MFTRSIRCRLQLWFAALLVPVLAGLFGAAYQLHRSNQFHQLDARLELCLAALSQDVRSSPGSIGPPGSKGRFDAREVRVSDPTLALLKTVNTNDSYFKVWSRRATLLKASAEAPASLVRPRPMDNFETCTHIRTRGSSREAFQFTERRECVLVGCSLADTLQGIHRFGWLLMAGGAAVLALGLSGGWAFITHALDPIREITATANRISAGSLSERINMSHTQCELGALASNLNATFARLEAAFAQQKQFTANASHELRTPITVLVSEAQTALARRRNAEDYRAPLEACLATAQQMRRLTETLLQLARLDAGLESVERSPLDLSDIAHACIGGIRPLASERGLRFHCDLALASALGDADLLSHVITNLLSNAIRHSPPNGQIRVCTRLEHAEALVSVADHGCGISVKDLPHIFERFYRGDNSRSRADGHSGLGLSIGMAIVRAHNGTIQVSSQPGTGSTFIVRLPARELSLMAA
jgi:two-component system, OmpR family, sensor kinase